MPILITVMLVVTIVCIVTGYIYYEMTLRHVLRGMEILIRKTDDQLLASNEYAAVVFKAQRKMDANLKRYGLLRWASEDYPTFFRRVQKIIPDEEFALESARAKVEEARFSDHGIGEHERDEMIESLRRIQYALSKVVLKEVPKNPDPVPMSVRKDMAEFMLSTKSRLFLPMVKLKELLDLAGKISEGFIDKEKPIFVAPVLERYILRVVQAILEKGILAKEPSSEDLHTLLAITKTKAREANRDFIVPQDIRWALIEGSDSMFEYNLKLMSPMGFGSTHAIEYVLSEINVPAV